MKTKFKVTDKVYRIINDTELHFSVTRNPLEIEHILYESDGDSELLIYTLDDSSHEFEHRLFKNRDNALRIARKLNKASKPR